MTSIGGAITRPDDFNEDRWLRVGAGPRQIERLRSEFMALSYDEKVAENQRMASLPDGELSASVKITADAGDPPPAAAPPADPTETGLPAAPDA